MSRLTAEQQALWSRSPREEWERRSELAERRGEGGRTAEWLIPVLVVAGLGALAWFYLGPDLRRYMKIRNM